MYDMREEREGVESRVELGGMAPRQVVIQGNKTLRGGRWSKESLTASTVPSLKQQVSS